MTAPVEWSRMYLEHFQVLEILTMVEGYQTSNYHLFVAVAQRTGRKMKAFEWIDRIKFERGIDTDYAVAKLLGVNQSNITIYRKRETTMDEDASINVAKALGIEPAGVILDQAAERIKSPEIRATLLAEARRLCILC